MKLLLLLHSSFLHSLILKLLHLLCLLHLLRSSTSSSFFFNPFVDSSGVFVTCSSFSFSLTSFPSSYSFFSGSFPAPLLLDQLQKAADFSCRALNFSSHVLLPSRRSPVVVSSWSGSALVLLRSCVVLQSRCSKPWTLLCSSRSCFFPSIFHLTVSKRCSEAFSLSAIRRAVILSLVLH